MNSLTARHEPGLAGSRTYRCSSCGFPITLLEADLAPACPSCGGTDFRPASMFSSETMTLPAPSSSRRPGWLADLRGRLPAGVPHLAWEGVNGLDVRPLPEGLTRIGRSLRADIPLVDPTVSRRHALIHHEGSTIAVLDDRSLNGVFVDGKRVDCATIEDGNELEIGAFRLYLLVP